jgi:hydroxymethylpyrimidine/phosphomethylpyrimidine kinase
MNILSIGGSDPSSGAGIQSDVKTFSSFNVHVLTVITAITGQNTTRFGMVEPVSKKMLEDQIQTVISDFRIDGVKIGMVYNSQITRVIYQQLKKLKVPIIVDPIIKSTTGGTLLENSAIKDFQKFIVPLATIITPNEFEAKIISNTKINSKISPKKIAEKIQNMGSKTVVITGIKTKNNEISDFVLEKNKNYFITGKKITSTNHGSGDNYSAAAIFALVKNNNIEESLKFAKQFTQESIRNSKKIGKGIPITDIKKQDNIKIELTKAINEFVEIKNIFKNIPECQTNFVFSKQNPKSIKDILGISGRIVKAGKQVLVAGNLEYGGSKHVATALLVMNKKSSEVCSAINIKYQNDTITKIKNLKLIASNYDRSKEPKNTKIKKSSIKWGIEHAIKNSKKLPDIIFHEGDFGKEPMIIVFGKTPNDVLNKILKII